MLPQSLTEFGRHLRDGKSSKSNWSLVRFTTHGECSNTDELLISRTKPTVTSGTPPSLVCGGRRTTTSLLTKLGPSSVGSIGDRFDTYRSPRALKYYLSFTLLRFIGTCTILSFTTRDVSTSPITFPADLLATNTLGGGSVHYLERRLC